MSTLTDEDLTILESLEFEPACEHSGHERNGSGTAEWAVVMTPVLECGCPGPSTVLWCGGCKDAILSCDAVLCNFCRAVVTPARNVLRIEPLR